MLRLHWLEVQRHVYANAWHGTATTIAGGWEAFMWQHFNRKQLLVCARPGAVDLAQLDRFVGSLKDWPAIVETMNGDAVEFDLIERGWSCGYELPGHFIPTGLDACLGLAEAPEYYTLREVDDDETLADFAYVQDRAYRESYDWPRGCAALFYTSPSSLIGPDTIGAVLYDPEGRPVRTAQIVAKRGIVAGIAGAAVPGVRGQHLGEPLMEHLRARAREVWGAEVVHHITMPVAVPIARRLKLEQVTVWRRWVR